MAKKKMSKKDLFIKQMNKALDSVPFSSSKYGEVHEWIDTGDLGLNRIISGDTTKGIPSGRVVVLGGESQSGKSFIAAQIAANAMNLNMYDVVYYFDGEGGAMKEFFESRGCNLDKIMHVLVDTVEDATLKIISTYKKIEEIQKELEKDGETFKALFILDSLGALITNKFFTDVEKKKVATDMGLRARACNNMVRACTIPALRTDVGLIIVNHIYDDPSALHATKLKNQSGGRGVQYMARLVIQCSKKFEKEDKSVVSSGTKDKDDKRYFAFTKLRFITAKNSFAQPTFESEMVLDFRKGPLKYYSIWDAAVKYGFIVKDGNNWRIPSYKEPDKKFPRKRVLLTPEIWESFMDEFNKKSIEELSYGGGEVIDAETALFEDENEDVDIEV